jgi:NSS family neurotransmitter:Na+ symporter
MVKKDQFFSRWGIVFAGLGMAIGTGNIWRFPRIVSQNGGGAFLIPWLLFLFIWAIPLLTIEISIGKKTRLGVIGSFGQLMGRKYAWMGTFVAFVTAAITFYYTVITGWCIKYLFASTFQGLVKKSSVQFWDSFTSSWEPIFFHLVAVGIGCFVIYTGVVKGIERANKFLIPSLFVLLMVACMRSLSLPGAAKGLDFLFSPNLTALADYKTWLNALSQTAWSTGAGWGLMLTYGVYSQKRENPLLTASTLGFGDYLASLLAAVAIIPTVFAVLASQNYSQDRVMEVMKSSNEGLTFIWIPQLFSKFPAGSFFLILFFLALCFAAFSSLIAHLELITRILLDGGLNRKKAVLIVGGVCAVMGLPSALSMGFFSNQDWVWSLGLMISGSFFVLLVLKVGPKKFRRDIVSASGVKVKLGLAFDILVKFFLPAQILVMLGWWIWTNYSEAPGNFFNIFAKSSFGTFLLQVVVAIGVFIALNKVICRKVLPENHES